MTKNPSLLVHFNDPVEREFEVASVSRPKSFLVPSRWLDPGRPGDRRHVLESKYSSRMGQARAVLS